MHIFSLVTFSLDDLPSAICEGSTNMQVCLTTDDEIGETIDIIVSVSDITTERKLLCDLSQFKTIKINDDGSLCNLH